MPGRSTFTATARGPCCVSFGAVHLRDGGGGDRRAERRESSRSGLPESGDDRRFRLACGNGGIRSCRVSRSRASATPTTSGRVARNWPSFT